MKEITEKYYYLRNQRNEPVLTVCLLQKDHETARGLALCNRRDIPCKKIGRAIAKGRAEKALLKEESSDLISREEAYNILHSVVSYYSFYYKI